MQREALLQSALKAVTQQRNETYGEPAIQLYCAARLINMYRQAMSVNPHRENYTAAHHRAVEDILQKISRIACGKPHIDNYRDIVGYAAIACELLGSVEEQGRNI